MSFVSHIYRTAWDPKLFKKVHWPINSCKNISLFNRSINNCFESCGKAKRASRGNFLLPTTKAATELEKSKNLLHNVERMKYITNMLYPSREHQLLVPAPLQQHNPKNICTSYTKIDRQKKQQLLRSFFTMIHRKTVELVDLPALALTSRFTRTVVHTNDWLPYLPWTN